MTEVVHSAKSDHKFNAMPKPFGAASPSQMSQPQPAVTGRTSPAMASSWQPPQRAPVAHATPAGLPPPAAPAPPPIVQHSRYIDIIIFFL